MARTKQTARKSTTRPDPDEIIEDSDEEMELEEGEEDNDASLKSTQDTASSKKTKTYKDPGTLVEVRNLYPGPKDKNGRWSWSTKYPTGKFQSATIFA